MGGPGLMETHGSVPIIAQVRAISHKKMLEPLFGRNVRSMQVGKKQTREEVTGHIHFELTADGCQDVGPWDPAISTKADPRGLRMPS